jgi:hypothetical protein
MNDENIKPVHINEDVWFYPTDKGFEFVVWSTHNKIGNRQAVQFRITKKKLAKYFNQA